jgi:hypothetical protein
MSQKPPKPRDTHAQIPANLPTAADGTDIGTKWQTPVNLEAALNRPQETAAPATASPTPEAPTVTPSTPGPSIDEK